MLFNEPKLLKCAAELAPAAPPIRFSALQRAEIAEIWIRRNPRGSGNRVSVLFNEPKLLKSLSHRILRYSLDRFSALQRAEIAEIL